MELPGSIISIVRLRSEPRDEIFDALTDGGVSCIEITLPTPGSEAAVRRWRERGVAMVGVGTIRTVQDVQRAHNAGAQFIVTPGTSLEVVAAAHDLSMPVACGALTPTEILLARTAGAELVKVFPINSVGGLDYVRSVAAPLPDIPLVPTGGVGVEETREYSRFGCAGVGVGSALVSDSLVEAAQWSEINLRAARFRAAWSEGVASRA